MIHVSPKMLAAGSHAHRALLASAMTANALEAIYNAMDLARLNDEHEARDAAVLRRVTMNRPWGRV